jgi:O-antigen/teichoic acid export membrane protein
MRRVFFSNLLFVVLLNLLVKPLWVLGIDRVAQNVLGRESYGLYFALFNLSYMLNIFIDMGVSYYNSRAVAGNPPLIKTMLANAVALKLLLSVVYLLASIGVALVWGINDHALVWLLVLCFNQVVQSFTIYLRTNLSAIQHYRLDSLVSVADKALMIALFGAILWTPLRGMFSVDWFVYGQTACLMATLLLAVWFNVRYAGKVSWSVDAKSLRDVWSRSWPYAVLVLFMSVYAKADGVMLERMVGASEAGVYAYGYRLFDATNQFGYLFAMLLMPMFSRMLANRENAQKLAESGFAALFMFTALVACASLVYRVEVMHLLYHQADAYSSNVFAAVMLALPGSAMVYIFGTLLAANANIRQLNIITAVGAIVNVGLNAFLIPVYGALGAAVVSVFTNTLVGVIEIAVCARFLNFKSDWPFVGRLMAFGLLTLGVFYASRSFVPNWWLGILIGGILSGLVAVVLKLVQPQQLATLVRSRAAR